MDCYDALEEQLLGVSLVIEDLYQSGFDTVHDSTLKELGVIAELAPQYGLVWLGEQIEQLRDILVMRRHRIEKQKDGATELYVNINAYLYLCLQKVTYDKCAKML